MFIDENRKMDNISKSELRTGMRVKTKAFGWYVVLRGVSCPLYRCTDVFVNDKDIWPFSDWNDDLTFVEGKYNGYDIVAVTEANALNMLVNACPSGDLMKDEKYVWVRTGKFRIDTRNDIPYDYKSDLRTGDLVELRNGDRYVIVRNTRSINELYKSDDDDLLIKLPDLDDTVHLSVYDKDLRLWTNPDKDIVKVVRNHINTDLPVNILMKRLINKDRLDGLYKYGIILERSEENEMLLKRNDDDLPF